MLPELTNEVAIVTGASSGIGAATARELARRGARVVLAARRVDELEAQARAIVGAGGSAISIPTDVTDAGQVERLVRRATDELGTIGVLVNNAGANWTTPLVSTSAADITRLVSVNLLGAMLLTRTVLPAMLVRGCGSIVSVGSLSGRVAMEPVYSAAKYGLRGFSLALRRQLAGTGVSVSLVSPGNIRTAMTADVDGQLPGPELVATTIAELISHPRREVVVPRRHSVIAWLDTLLPPVADTLHRRRDWARVR